jgi:hypothetical protein
MADAMQLDDRVTWTDRSNLPLTGRYRGDWQGFAAVALDAVQPHGNNPAVLNIKVDPANLRRAGA